MITYSISLAVISALAALAPFASATASPQSELTRRQFYGAWGWYPGYTAGFGIPGVTSALAFPAVNSAVVSSAASASTIPFVDPVASASVAAPVVPFLAKRQWRYGGYGGYGGYSGYDGWGWGFPLVSSFNSVFDRASNRANFNENTLYSNNINANQANDAVHSSISSFVSG
ncbi:hypothetical protein EC988_001431 [Linderina pennispora]|nr:hypothetical protein EC988_001431 [Linderina pennispora]